MLHLHYSVTSSHKLLHYINIIPFDSHNYVISNVKNTPNADFI